MSDNPTTRDSIIKQAQNVPQLVSAAERFDPALAESLTPKALWASKSAPGTLLVAVITYLVSKYGLGWDGGTVDLVSGAAVLIGAYGFRAITRSPIGGLFSKGTPTNA